MPVEVGGDHPAVQQHHGRPVAAGVAQEELAAAGDVRVRAGGISIGGYAGATVRSGHRRRSATIARSARPTISPMAVVIASDLGKDIAGEPLLRGISFKLERRERMTLSGRNGAGKTTLLRMLSGEASIDGGELVFAKDTRSRCTTSARRAIAASRCATTCCPARPSWWRSSSELAALEQAMAGGAHDEATLDRYAEAQARLEHAGGYDWRERALMTLHGLGFRDETDLDRPLDTFSGGELTRASLGARSPETLTCCCSTSPPTTWTSPRWSGSSSIWSASTPRSSWSPTTAGSWRRWGLRCSSSRPARAGSSTVPGTPGGSEKAARELASAGRSNANRPRSSAWSGS